MSGGGVPKSRSKTNLNKNSTRKILALTRKKSSSLFHSKRLAKKETSGDKNQKKRTPTSSAQPSQNNSLEDSRDHYQGRDSPSTDRRAQKEETSRDNERRHLQTRPKTKRSSTAVVMLKELFDGGNRHQKPATNRERAPPPPCVPQATSAAPSSIVSTQTQSQSPMLAASPSGNFPPAQAYFRDERERELLAKKKDSKKKKADVGKEKKLSDEVLKEYFTKQASKKNASVYAVIPVVDDPKFDALPQRSARTFKLPKKKKRQHSMEASLAEASTVESSAMVSMCSAEGSTMTTTTTTTTSEPGAAAIFNQQGLPFWTCPMSPAAEDLDGVDEDGPVTNEHVLMLLCNTIMVEPKPNVKRVRDADETMAVLFTQDAFFDCNRIFTNTIQNVIRLSSDAALKGSPEHTQAETGDEEMKTMKPTLAFEERPPTVMSYDRSRPVESVRQRLALLTTAPKAASSNRKSVITMTTTTTTTEG